MTDDSADPDPEAENDHDPGADPDPGGAPMPGDDGDRRREEPTDAGSDPGPDAGRGNRSPASIDGGGADDPDAPAASDDDVPPEAADSFESDPAPPDHVRRENEGTVVPKANFCEQCEHFADPPRVACTREGTEIRELVDREHFRVVNCPVVAERDRLREGGAVPGEDDADGDATTDDR